jgi:hypothetical protein
VFGAARQDSDSGRGEAFGVFLGSSPALSRSLGSGSTRTYLGVGAGFGDRADLAAGGGGRVNRVSAGEGFEEPLICVSGVKRVTSTAAIRPGEVSELAEVVSDRRARVRAMVSVRERP